MLLEKQSRPGRGRVNSLSKFQLPQVSKLDQSDLLSSVQSVGTSKRDSRPPPSTRGFFSRNRSNSSGNGEEGFSGGYNLVMAQVEERRRLQSLGLATNKKSAGSPSPKPNPSEEPSVAKTRKRSSWQPPLNGKLQKSRSKSRDGRKGEQPPTPTEFLPPHTFSRIYNAPPTPPPEPRDRMAKEFVLPNAMASGSDFSFSKPRPPFADTTNSSTSSFGGSNSSRSSLVSLTPSLDKSVYTLPPLSLGGLADVFTNEDGISGRAGSSTSLAKFSSQTTSTISPVSATSLRAPASPRFVTAPSSPACNSPLKRDLGHRKPSPPSAWKGVNAEEDGEERGRPRHDRACHQYFSEDQERRHVLRKMDNLPPSPQKTPTHNSITASTASSATASTVPSTVPSLSPPPAASRKASTTSTISSIASSSTGNVPKRYVRGEDIEKVNPVTIPYVEPAHRPQVSPVPSDNIMPPSPAPSPQPPEAIVQMPEALPSVESLLPPPPVPPRAPWRVSRDSSLTRQMNSNTNDDEIEEIAPLKPTVRLNQQLVQVPSIGDMMKELEDDTWSVLDGVPERRPTLPKVPSVIPAMHKRHSELPNVARLPVRYMHNDSVGSLQISSGMRSPSRMEDNASIHLPTPLPSPSVPSEEFSPDSNEKARVSRVLARPASGLSDRQSIEERRKSTDSSKFKFMNKFHHRSKTQPVPSDNASNDPSDVTDCMLPPHERPDWRTSTDLPAPQGVKMALIRSQTGLPSPTLTESSASSLQPPSKASASSSSTSLTTSDEHSRSGKIKVFTICCSCHAFHDLPAKFYTVLFTKVAPVECIWCQHQMTSCCEVWTAVTNLVEKHS